MSSENYDSVEETDVGETDDPHIEVEAVALERCFFNGNKLAPGGRTHYSGPRSAFPDYLMEVTPEMEDIPGPLGRKREAALSPNGLEPVTPQDPSAMNPTLSRTQEQQEEAKSGSERVELLSTVVADLPMDDLKLWSANTGRPKVSAVNRVLSELGEPLTNAAELQSVQITNQKALR